MKHVFWIHSHITFLVSEMVISQLKLKKEDLVFLTYRNYKLPRPIEGVTLYEIPSYDPILKESEDGIKIKWSEILNFDFEFYIPQSREKLIHLILSIDNCKSYNYIEEGLLAYNYKDSKFKIASHVLLRRTGLRKRMRMLDYTNKKFKKAFCINDKAFKNCKEKKVLQASYTKPNYEDKDLFGTCIILVFDAIVPYNMVSQEESIKLLEIIIKHLIITNQTKVFFKFHPEQLRIKNQAEILEIKNVFSKNSDIEFKELGSNVILEELLFFNKNITIYNYVSSTGLYANLLGNEVVSVSDRIDVKIANSIKKDWKQI